jgi:ABC-type antimicrobial peptide transport system permease subunit
MACAIIIMLWVNNELNTDSFFDRNIHILRKQMVFSDGQITIDPAMTAPLGPAIANEVPEVIATTRMSWDQRILFRLGEKAFYEKGFYADSSFFRMFPNQLKIGSSKKVLEDPNSVVISEKLAKKYFGNENPVGKNLIIRSFKEELYTVTGVFYNTPKNSSIEYEYIIPFSKYQQFYGQYLHWGNYNLLTLVQAKPNTDVNVLSEKIDKILKKNDSFSKNTKIFARPLADMYLKGFYLKSIDNPSGRITDVRIFSIVAIFLIFLACMNYTNLATALAIKRAKEVGVKKVFGSNRKKLVLQFTLEAMVLTFVAFIISLILVELALPHVKLFLGKEILIDYKNWALFVQFLSIPIVTGILAGTFPAIYLSSFKPVVVLKSLIKHGKASIKLRHVLVVFQFVVTIAFIITSIVTANQIKYIHNKTLGLDKNNVLFFEQTLHIQKQRKSFKEELIKQKGVLSVTYTSSNPLEVNSSTAGANWRGKPQNQEFLFPYIAVDQDFVETLGVEVVEGRNFSVNYKNDENAIMVNQEAVKVMQLSNPVGEIINYWDRRSNIIGVVKDFHIGNLRVPIKQLLIICKPEETFMVMIKISGNNRREALKNIEKVFREFESNVPFEYEFVDKQYAKNYEGETYMSRFTNLFAVLAIIISCLGLFGLALFTAEHKTKEIGIRKSMGASTAQIMLLLGNDFLRWIIISFAIASLFSWAFLTKWLQNYAYKTELNWWIFAAAGGIAVLLAFITVAWQSYKAASKNPVDSLRYE